MALFLLDVFNELLLDLLDSLILLSKPDKLNCFISLISWQCLRALRPPKLVLTGHLTRSFMLRINMAWGIDFFDALELLLIEHAIFVLKLPVLGLQNLIIQGHPGLIPARVGGRFSPNHIASQKVWLCVVMTFELVAPVLLSREFFFEGVNQHFLVVQFLCI